MADHIEEKATRAKEISDLKSEIQKTERLLSEGRWNELSAHLQGLNVKYLLEAGVYNLVNPYPPQTLQENAQNCLKFLSTLLVAKSIDMGTQQ